MILLLTIIIGISGSARADIEDKETAYTVGNWDYKSWINPFTGAFTKSSVTYNGHAHKIRLTCFANKDYPWKKTPKIRPQWNILIEDVPALSFKHKKRDVVGVILKIDQQQHTKHLIGFDQRHQQLYETLYRKEYKESGDAAIDDIIKMISQAREKIIIRVGHIDILYEAEGAKDTLEQLIKDCDFNPYQHDISEPN